MDALAEGNSSLLGTVVRFFEEDEWNFRQLEGRPVLMMGFKGESGGWTCYAQVREEQDRFIFYSVLESNVPPDKRLAAAEYLTRANYGLVIGNFEMDFSDGEVRYKTSIDVEGGELTLKMCESLVYANVLTMDRYFTGLMSVVYGGISPEEAIAKIEG